MLGDGPAPHLKGFPSAKPVEKFKGFYLEIKGLFLGPLADIEESMGFAANVLAESLLADSVVLES